MTATLVVASLLLAALLWLFLGGRAAPDRPGAAEAPRRDNPDIDYAELEQAERDVQEAPAEESVRDWGPGAQKPPVG